MKNRFAYLDILRVLAVVLVMFGHFVLVGGGATALPQLINVDFSLPLIDHAQWSIWKFEAILVGRFSTQSAILGVALFFIITGYLMPMMLERYTRRDFLINRFFRISPVLFVALIVSGVFIWVTQGIVFELSSYLASITLTYLVFGVVPVVGVLWTLTIEVLFYIFAALMGRFSIRKLCFFQCLLLALIAASVKWSDVYYLMVAASQLKYMLFICMGSAIYLAEKEQGWYRRIALVFGALMLTYLGLQFYRVGHEDASTYNNLGAQLLVLGLFLFFYFMSKLGFLHKLPRFVYWYADLVYPIYLVHAALGFGVMALTRSVTNNPYVMLFSAVLVATFASWLLHKYVEVPGISIGRRFIKRPEAARFPEAAKLPEVAT